MDASGWKIGVTTYSVAVFSPTESHGVPFLIIGKRVRESCSAQSPSRRSSNCKSPCILCQYVSICANSHFWRESLYLLNLVHMVRNMKKRRTPGPPATRLSQKMERCPDSGSAPRHFPGFSEKGGWICQDFKTGKKIWNEDRNPDRDISKSGSITFADGNLYCFENTREVRLLQATPKGYKQQGEFRPPQAQGRHTWTHPVVANGKLYLRDQRMIFCYDLRRPGGGYTHFSKAMQAYRPAPGNFGQPEDSQPLG